MGITLQNYGKEKKGKKKGYTFGLAFAFFLFLSAILIAPQKSFAGTEKILKVDNNYTYGAVYIDTPDWPCYNYNCIPEMKIGIAEGDSTYYHVTGQGALVQYLIGNPNNNGSQIGDLMTSTFGSGSWWFCSAWTGGCSGLTFPKTVYVTYYDSGGSERFFGKYTLLGSTANNSNLTITPPDVSTHFTAISFSTTTQSVNVQGYINGTSTPLAWSQQLQVWKLTQQGQFNEWGRDYLGGFRATTTGAFDVTYSYLPDSYIQGNNNVYSLVAGTTFEGDLKQEDSTGLTLITSTSTTLTATSTQYIFDATTGQLIWNSTMGSTSSTTASDSNFLGFLNVPQLLATKWPFAYIFQISSILISGIASTSAVSIPSSSFSVHLGVAGHASTTLQVDMFSTSTIAYFLTPTATSTLRALMVAVTYFSTLWFLFHEAKHKKML